VASEIDKVIRVLRGFCKSGPAVNEEGWGLPQGVAFPFVATTPMRIGFFGPFGTFTEQALLTQSDLAAGELVPFRSVPDVLDAVARGDVDAGFVPIENSIEGTVNFTQDALIFDYELLIQREVVLDIEHCLLAAPGTQLADVNLVLSIPVATAQCSAWLRENMPKADVHAANSTADAARLVGERSTAGEKGLAALAPSNAAARHDKTGLVVFQRADEPGSLISILQEFAARRINLSLLSSRPTKAGGLGDYCFIIYADGHVADELMADVLRDLHTKQGGVKFLGSYPAAGDHAPNAREHADARWQQADDWITELRTHIRK